MSRSISLPSLRAAASACGAQVWSTRWIAVLLLVGCAKGPSATTAAGMRGLPLVIEGAEGAWALAEEPELLASGRWIRVGEEVAFVYVDPEAGLTARVQDDERIRLRRLLWAPAGATEVDPADLGLPAVPAWVEESYGRQPPPGTPYGHWRADPRLAGRLHPAYPDDLRVVVGVRTDEGVTAELPWLSLRACDEAGCWGTLLNEPFRDLGVSRGDALGFRWRDLEEGVPAPAVPPGEDVPGWLAEAARSYRGALQDDPAMVPDWSLPEAERLPPVGTWGRLMGMATWSFMQKDGPWLLLITGDGSVMPRRMDWRPRGLVDLTEEEIAAAGLEPLVVEGALEQPPPGPCCGWRLDERLDGHLGAGSPDGLHAILVDEPLRVGVHEAVDDGVLASISLYACDGQGCDAVVLDGPHAGRDAWLPWLALEAEAMLERTDDGDLAADLGDMFLVPVAELR